MAAYFERAGLRPGDVVAIGGSGSFPAFVLASLCAARALELRPVLIYSVGASMYGANIPGFTFVDMLARLRAEGLLPYSIAAVAPGGEHDTGRGVLFDEEGTTLFDEARRSGLPLVEGATLADRIRRRLQIYDAAAGEMPIRCFVNIGGATANYGDTAASLGGAERPGAEAAVAAGLAVARPAVRVRGPGRPGRAPAVRERARARERPAIRPGAVPAADALMEPGVFSRLLKKFRLWDRRIDPVVLRY